MLVLSIKEGEILTIGDVKLYYRYDRRNQVKMHLTGPKEIPIHRTKEFAEKLTQKEKTK
jgi:sRNA-binding carbon storage regulator CsrA